jgi:hypothetical protein
VTATPALPTAIGRPAQRALLAAGYTGLRDLHGVERRRVLELHGVGPKALRVLEQALAERGWSLREA